MLSDSEIHEYRTRCSKCGKKSILWVCVHCGHDDGEEFQKKLEEDLSEERKDE